MMQGKRQWKSGKAAKHIDEPASSSPAEFRAFLEQKPRMESKPPERQEPIEIEDRHHARASDVGLTSASVSLQRLSTAEGVNSYSVCEDHS